MWLPHGRSVVGSAVDGLARGVRGDSWNRSPSQIGVAKSIQCTPALMSAVATARRASDRVL
jgi:hypothetical protein